MKLILKIADSHYVEFDAKCQEMHGRKGTAVIANGLAEMLKAALPHRAKNLTRPTIAVPAIKSHDEGPIEVSVMGGAEVSVAEGDEEEVEEEYEDEEEEE